MQDYLDAAYLPQIDEALSKTGWLPKLPPGLAEIFYAEGDAARWANNRIIVLIFVAIFDVYWLAQRQLSPDIVFISGLLRFAFFTPFALLYCILHLRLRPWLLELYLLAIAIGACFITVFLCLHTMQKVAEPEIYGTPLILLYSGVLLRMRLPALAVNVTMCTAAYVAGIIACPMLSPSNTGTFIFLQFAIAVAISTFNVQIEIRDRKVFLLTCNERIRRSLVAEQNRGLLRESQTDVLTSLANRRCFDETLSMEWLNALASGKAISLIMIDIDHFKKFNDFYGHLMGDDCLRLVAGVLRAETRPGDLVARYGGEEFAVVLPDSEEVASLEVAKRLLAGVEGLALPHEGLGSGARVAISLGVATARPDNAQNASRLIEEADRNLYAAKHAGRNRVSTSAEEGGDVVRAGAKQRAAMSRFL